MMNKKSIIIIFGILFFLIIIVSLSYGFFVYNKDVADVSLDTGQISIDFLDVSSISLTNIVPKSDYEGKNSQDYIDFSVTGTTDIEPILYEIQIVPTSNNISEKYIRLYLTDQNDVEIISPYSYSELYTGTNNIGKAIYQDLIEGNNDGTSKTTTINYRLRVWIDENYPEAGSKTFIFDINLYAKNVDKTNLEKVTFNSNDERENGLVKYVEEGEEYGNLPTPIKEGYTFKGWNGKNKFDKSKYLLLNNYSTFNIEYNWANIYLTSNTTYKISIIRYNDYEGIGTPVIVGYTMSPGSDSQWSAIRHHQNPNRSVTNYIYTPGDSGLLYIGYVKADTTQESLDTLWSNTDIQIEEGSLSTAYEPYFITSDTTVVQDSNHTLKAIWEENG